MRKSILGLTALLLATTAAPAFAQDDTDSSGLSVTGGVTLVSDYRFRGFSQNGEKAAIQGTINLNHESGFYVGTWASSIDFPDIDGSGNGLTTEIDLYGGYTTEVSPGLTVDVGLLYYLYPKHVVGNVDTDFFEPYVNVTGTSGPFTLKVGANYAWDQSAIGDESAIYLHAEPSVSIPNTPLGLNAHLGWAKSDSFLGGPDGDVFDYSIGATAAWKMLTFGVSYVNTDVKRAFGKEAIGADGAVIFSIGASF